MTEGEEKFGGFWIPSSNILQEVFDAFTRS